MIIFDSSLNKKNIITFEEGENQTKNIIYSHLKLVKIAT
jgi:hypothetical protein